MSGWAQREAERQEDDAKWLEELEDKYYELRRENEGLKMEIAHLKKFTGKMIDKHIPKIEESQNVLL